MRIVDLVSTCRYSAAEEGKVSSDDGLLVLNVSVSTTLFTFHSLYCF